MEIQGQLNQLHLEVEGGKKMVIVDLRYVMKLEASIERICKFDNIEALGIRTVSTRKTWRRH